MSDIWLFSMSVSLVAIVWILASIEGALKEIRNAIQRLSK